MKTALVSTTVAVVLTLGSSGAAGASSQVLPQSEVAELAAPDSSQLLGSDNRLTPQNPADARRGRKVLQEALRACDDVSKSCSFRTLGSWPGVMPPGSSMERYQAIKEALEQGPLTFKVRIKAARPEGKESYHEHTYTKQDVQQDLWDLVLQEEVNVHSIYELLMYLTYSVHDKVYTICPP